MRLRVRFLLATLLSIPGCGTVATQVAPDAMFADAGRYDDRAGCKNISRVYGGVSYDLCERNSEWGGFYILDLPLSLVGDTVLLPLTIYQQSKREPAPPAAVSPPPEPISEMVDVPVGAFLMGCNETVDTECEASERPGRPIDLAAFAIDKTEVTVAQYRECVSAGPCYELDCGYPGREANPIDCVTADDAERYCTWKEKRLPTQAEWEKAARGTDGRKYPWGNAPATCELAVTRGCGSGAQPVGSRPAGASPYGALDMAGNVWEWTAETYSFAGARHSTTALRGGSWESDPSLARSSYSPPDPLGRPDTGFRCAR